MDAGKVLGQMPWLNRGCRLDNCFAAAGWIRQKCRGVGKAATEARSKLLN